MNVKAHHCIEFLMPDYDNRTPLGLLERYSTVRLGSGAQENRQSCRKSNRTAQRLTEPMATDYSPPFTRGPHPNNDTHVFGEGAIPIPKSY